MCMCVWVGVGVCVVVSVGVYVYASVLLGFLLYWVSFEKLKSDYNQTWVKDEIGFSYINEVKGHVELFL